jgi:NAD(P)-dependent dehydrogenase (short-subunit alcohol dehydrogenase family)
MNLTDDGVIGKLAAAVAERWGKLDILVLNAATLGTLTPVPAIDPKEFGKVMTLNLLAPQALIAAFDTLLRKSEHGRVIALTSSVGSKPRAYWGGYGASKAALENLVLSYADEVARVTPIRVAIVDPGATATVMRARAFPGEDPATIKPPAEVGEAIAELLGGKFESGFRLEVGSEARA